MRVLIVDDEVLIATCLLNIACSRGHTARMETNGQKGLIAWREFQPHLVFLDVLMPGLDGHSLLRQAGKQNNEKVVMMSAHRAFSKDFTVPHVDLFQPKPFKSIVEFFLQAEKLCLNPALHPTL